MNITISFSITIDAIDGAFPRIHIAPVTTAEEHCGIVPTPSSAQDSEVDLHPEPEPPDTLPSEQGEPELQETEQAPLESGQRNPAGRFRWTPEMIETLERDFQAASQATPQRAVRSILNAIAEEHGWPPGAVGYKFYERKAGKQQGWTDVPTPAAKQPAKAQSEQNPPEQAWRRKIGTTKTKGEVPGALIASENPPSPSPLTPGDVSWEVRTDGMPMKLNLAYKHGAFPYPANSRVSYRDRIYRVGRSWNTGFGLTSEDADIYETQ